MTTSDERPTAGPDRFERFATRVGDLDSPFYDEERERDVWNEASAVAFQLLLWGSPLVAAVTLWIGGGTALPATAAMLLPWAAAAAVAMVHTLRHGVDPGRPQAFSRGRAWAWTAVMVALGSSLLHAAAMVDPSTTLERFLRGAAQGAAVTLVVGSLAAAVAVMRGPTSPA